MIGIVDYGMGNLKSVYNAFQFLGAKVDIIDQTKYNLDSYSHLVIPGVGAFSQAMDNLNKLNFTNSINQFILTDKPVLGICLGMQLLASIGNEPYKVNGLNLVKGEVKKFPMLGMRIPHVGWNSIILKKDHYLFDGVKADADFYFVHSYYFNVFSDDNIIANCHYGLDFPAVVGFKNITGIQFHPEKSQKHGLKILENFAFNESIS